MYLSLLTLNNNASKKSRVTLEGVTLSGKYFANSRSLSNLEII